MKERSLAAHQADSRVTSLIQQSIVAWPLIQSYSREEDEQKRFTAQTAHALEKERRSMDGRFSTGWSSL